MLARRINYAAPGFTLIELVMVILILAILAIAILPRIPSTSIYTQRGYQDMLLQALQYGRDIAMARGCRVQAVIYGNDFYFMQDANCDSSTYLRSRFTQPIYQPDQSTRLEYNRYNVEGHAAIGTASNILVFEPSGTVSIDNAGVLGSFSTVTITAGTRSYTLYGDTAYVE